MLLWTSLEIRLFFFTNFKWWIFSSILHKWKMDFYSLNPMDYHGTQFLQTLDLLMVRYSDNYLFLHGHFWTQSNWSVPSAANPFPKFNSCLHCTRNVFIQQKLMRGFKYLDSLFCYLGKYSKDILESANYQEAISAILLTCLYSLTSKLPPPVPFSTRLSSTVPPSLCLPLR